MPDYKYKAITNTGKNISGEYTAKSINEVKIMMKENEYYPVKIEEVVKGKEINILEAFNRIKIKDIAVFCRQLYTMLNAGVTIIKSLDILRVQTENKKLRLIMGALYEEVQKGLTFSEALKNHQDTFPELLINMVEAGEVSGNLDIIMDRLATHYEKENKINNKVKGAMVYPIILSIVATVVVIFLLTFVMPTFVSMFEGSGVELPLPTRILLNISSSISDHWYIWALGVAGLAYGCNLGFRSNRVKDFIDYIKFRIPVVKGTTQKVVTSRFTRTLSTLLRSGIPLIEALEVVSKIVGNRIVAQGILGAKEDVKKGLGLAEPIKNLGLFPPMVDSMISIGEESGSLDDILDRTANFYDEEVEVALQKMTTILEPLMIVIMAVVIGAIVIAMVLPMFDMFNTINF